MCLFVTEFDSLEVILCRLTDRLNPAVSFFFSAVALCLCPLCFRVRETVAAELEENKGFAC